MEEERVGYDGGAVQEWHRSASHIRVASGVTEIPVAAFRGCENLRAVDLSDVSAVEIGGRAFGYCDRLREIDISNATKIGPQAFQGCTALQCVTISTSVDEIEGWAFHDCKNLEEVELGEGIQRIGNSAFRFCNALVRISIPSSVAVIEPFTFQLCSRMTEVELKEGLQCIEDRAFQDCKSLLRISIPTTVSKVEGYAFSGCSSLAEVDLNEGLQGIEQHAFLDCNSLERITVPSSTTLVESRAFARCRSLTEVTLHEGVQEIGESAFHSCPLQHISIPPVACVIDIQGRYSSCQLLRGAMPTPRDRAIVASKWMQYRGPSQLEQAKAKVNEILGRQQTDEEKIRCIREWFAYFDLLDVTTMLELAIWRANMDGNQQDAEARQERRRMSGSDMNITSQASCRSWRCKALDSQVMTEVKAEACCLSQCSF